MAPSSAATSGTAKPYAYEAAKKALTEHLNRGQISGEIVHGEWRGHYRVRFDLEGSDRVSIVIPNFDGMGALRACLTAIEEKTSYRNYEVIVVDDGGMDAKLRKWLESQGYRIILADESASLSRRINLGTAQAHSPYLLLLAGETEVISADWITSMLGFCKQEKIGAVGAKLFQRSGKIQHIGVVLGLKGVIGYPLQGYRARPLGYPDPSQFVRNCSAVSGACMMVRKEMFEKLGGFDERVPNTYNDIDFCLRVREAGFRIVWTPEAELYYDAAGNSVDDTEIKYFEERWAQVLKSDPYYNPNLTVQYDDVGYRV